MKRTRDPNEPWAMDDDTPKPRRPRLSDAQRDVLRQRMAHARRVKVERFAAARAAGFKMPAWCGKGRSMIDCVLPKAVLDEYLALLRDPYTTSKTAWQWLVERGYPIGIKAVDKHRTRFRQRMDRQREAAEMSITLAEVARERGVADATDASAFFVEQQMMLTLFNVLDLNGAGKEFDAKRWQAIHKAVGEAIRNRATMEKFRQYVTPPAAKALPPADPFETDKAVREILNVPPISRQQFEAELAEALAAQAREAGNEPGKHGSQDL